jgi:hypothetical protein
MEELNEFQSLLASLFGNLVAHTDKQKKDWDTSLPLAAEALMKQDLSQIHTQTFTIDKTDLFNRDKVSPERLNTILKAADLAVKKTGTEDMKVFVREVPIRTTQLINSVPIWAAGAKPTLSIGPLERIDGRTIFLDFFKVVKMITLYQQGNPNPALLFNAGWSERKKATILTPSSTARTEYILEKGSIWVRANILAANAPANRYFGLAVNGGKVTLSVKPALQSGKLVMTPATSVKVQLQLDSIPQSESLPDKKYGKDAKNVSLELPSKLDFSFKGNALGKVDDAGKARWKVYGQEMDFQHHKTSAPYFHQKLNRVMIPYQSNRDKWSIDEMDSDFLSLQGQATIQNSWWAIPAAFIDINNPLEVSGAGAMAILAKEGIKARWQGQEGKSGTLQQPFLMVEEGRINITDLKSKWLGTYQELEHWKDDLNPNGTSISLDFQNDMPFVYNSLAEGTEMVMAEVFSEVKVDRPMQVSGLPISVKTQHSVLLMAAMEDQHLVYLFDDNILWDNKLPFDRVPRYKPIALALENALFTISPVNGCLLFGKCQADWKRITDSHTFLVFGLFAYMPTLPDPYLANFRWLGDRRSKEGSGMEAITNWLVAHVHQKSNGDELDTVKLSFHYGNQIQSAAGAAPIEKIAGNNQFTGKTLDTVINNRPEPFRKDIIDFEEWYERYAGQHFIDRFALLDVSSNANQLGVSVGRDLNPRRISGLAIYDGDHSASIQQVNPGLSINGMQVSVTGAMTRLFTLPQVAWEPVINLTPPTVGKIGDPPLLFNYYANDGGPTRIMNNSSKPVVLAPIPVSDFILQEFKDAQTEVYLQFTLPFGLKALATLSATNYQGSVIPKLNFISPNFEDEIKGGIQVSALAGSHGKKPAGEPHLNDLPMFAGFTVQLNNVLNGSGISQGASTLGDSVTTIFNNEFFMDTANPGVLKERGVPVSRVDLTGYGASIFSNWLSPSAAIAETSQARFDVMLGRTGHEVIQVKSLIYPWGIRVVRTITLFRLNTGFVFRTDSGWQPESDGLFDFRYKYNDINGDPQHIAPYELHPGVINGLFNIKNIKEDGLLPEFSTKNSYKENDLYINEFGNQVKHGDVKVKEEDVLCVPVWFDANIGIENVVQGHQNGKVPAKKILGYVQLKPAGLPLSPDQVKALLDMQGGIIGGDIDCTVDINKSGQQMRINRFDISASINDNKPDEPIFVVAARGGVLLPQDGSWSMVQHNVGTGEVTPLPAHLPVPLIREGEWIVEKVINPQVVSDKLARIADTREILRLPTTDSLNYGFLQSTATQKALFLTPSYQLGIKKLLSKTPPVFADAYKLMTSNSIFPNIGNAIDNFGTATVLFEGVDLDGVKQKAFKELGIEDAGKKVLELMKIDPIKQGEALVEQQFQLLAGKANEALGKVMEFDIPDLEVNLVNMDSLRIYIEYKTKSKEQANNQYVSGKLDFDINSFSTDLKDKWKSRVNNVGMVVDLGSFKRLMTIKGNFDAQKGKESGFEGNIEGGTFGGLPVPEVEFSDELKPVIEILQILASLSTGDYGAVMKRGLKIAMGNAGELWEYKFEATKEIPAIRFPPSDELYNSPTTPLRLEASLALGVYFNAALKVTTDPKQLLPTAGGFIQFKGGLEVMCVTVGGATIYAIGAVELKVACDTKIGPSLEMKFGFGANITVGLPVIGSVSVTYMVGAEIYASATVVEVKAFMLFKGRASILGGIVTITIYIEASGGVKRIAIDANTSRTECTASVTFALDISIFLIINISFEETWQESRQIA